MLNLTNVMLGSQNPKALAEFYGKLLDRKPDMQDGEEWFGFMAGPAFLSMGPHDKVKGKSSNPERIILNFETKEIMSEFERIKALGAKVIAEPYNFEGKDEPQIATFADPDGNYFQITLPWNG